MDFESRESCEYIARLIEHLDQPTFPDVLINALAQIASFDSTVIYLYQRDFTPIDLFHWPAHNAIASSSTLDEYEASAYLLDPFFQACQRRIEPGAYTLRGIAPDRFFHSEYFRTYYIKTRITDELGLFAHLSEHRSIVISLCREGSHRRFSRREIRDLKAVEPIVRAAVLHHWKAAVREPNPNEGPQISLESIVQSAPTQPGKSALTAREAEVVGLVLQGHSSESAGLLLGISRNTVKVHRKHVYAKLGISTQAELFSTFLPALPGIVR